MKDTRKANSANSKVSLNRTYKNQMNYAQGVLQSYKFVYPKLTEDH